MTSPFFIPLPVEELNFEKEIRGGKEECEGQIESTKRRSGLFCNWIFNGNRATTQCGPWVENNGS